MKKFYILFFSLPILVWILVSLSVWGAAGGLAAVMIFLLYRYYSERVQASRARNEILEDQVAELHERLETAVLKEQKTSKEAEQARKLKQQLLSVISHEVRTPMNGVMGMSLLLTDTSLTAEQKEYVDTIRNCGESLLTTVNNMLANDILDFSKLQQEGKQLEYKDFDLRDSVEEVLEMFAEKAGKAGVDLVYDIAGNVPEQIIGDSKRLRQVLMNLVENAVRFTRQGEVFVGINYTLPTSTGHPPDLNFEVRDTGSGIGREQLKHLFKGIPGKEFKTDTETESGLGLVICRKLVELMGGNIEVKSVEEQGTSFTFNIPLTPSLKLVRDHARQSDMTKLEGKHILIIDDNETCRTVLHSQMKTWKMAVVTADSGKQALEILSKNKFDLVLTDIHMPVMDGLQLAKSIRDQYPALPVIGMNFRDDENYTQEPALFSSLVAKPMRQSNLRNKVLDIFSGASLTDQSTLSSILSDNIAELYPLRILVAEDNPVNQKIALKILNKLGYEPALASHGKEVLEMVGQEHFDIILMDVQMPEMDGLEATRMIRTCLEIQPVIIALTANAMQGDRDECMQAGMDDYMSKPIQLKELVNQLEKWAGALANRRKMSA